MKIQSRLTKHQKTVIEEKKRIDLLKRHICDRYEKSIAAIKLREKKLYEFCKHDGNTIYHEDPSGGNDSYSTCCLCDGEMPNKWD